MAAPFVIVGAGEAGVHAAIALRELGYAGDLLLVGDEVHDPYERPPLSKFNGACVLPELKRIGRPDALAKVELIRGVQVTAIQRDRKRLLTSIGTEIGFEKLLLATGARPRRLSLPNGQGQGIRYLRTLDDAALIRGQVGPGAQVLVIGGGLIGLELAASARACGAEVTVLESQAGVLRRGMALAIAAAVAERHRREGVRIHCGVAIRSLQTGPDGQRITLADGQALAADAIIAGTGSVPNTELAEAADIATADGILVDEAMRTSDPDIFAAGDCCRFPLRLYGDRPTRLESWRSAQEHGRAAAAGMLGIGSDVVQVPWFWSDQYDLGIQVAGLFDAAERLIERSPAPDTHLTFGLASDGTMVAAAGMGRGNAVARDIKLAEKLIAGRMQPNPANLADPAIGLKSLLAACS